MRRKLIFIFGILLFFGFVSVNCNAQSSTNDQRIVGTWSSNITGFGHNFSVTLVFNVNRSGTITTTDPKSYPKNGTFAYGVSIAGKLSMVFPYGHYLQWDPSDEIFFSPDGKTMIIRR